VEVIVEGENVIILNVKNLTSAAYIIKIGLKDQTVSKRFIKL